MEASEKQQPQLTLGALLYADKTRHAIPESDWVALVQSIAAGSQRALRSLYDRSAELVSTLVSRITSDAELTKDVLLDVFYDVWRRAPGYDPDKESTVAWISRLARARALERTRLARGSRNAETAGKIVARHESTRNDLWARLARRIALETGTTPVLAGSAQWKDPDWNEVAAGTWVKLLATDVDHDRVSMLVRLAPNIAYPPHTHAGVEELHLLEGELWIDGRKLYAGDYNRAEAGTADKRVWTETGCACVLITSLNDVIG